MRSSRVTTVTVLAATALAGCPFVTSGESTGFFGSGSGGGGAGGAGPSASASSASSAQSSSSSGKTFCVPGSMHSCYTGMPPTTADAGACHGGLATCTSDGSGFGPCQGEVTPEPDNCASKLNAHCDAMELACMGTVVASGGRAWGESNEERGLGIAIDSKGNSIVGGFFNGTLAFGTGTASTLKCPDGSSDGFVASYAPTGALNWVVQLGGGGTDQVTALALDANDNVFVVGSFNDQITFATPSTVSPITGGPGIFVLELDHTGTAQWANGYPGSNGSQAPKAVALSPDGALLAVAGFASGSLKLGSTTIQTQSGSDTDGFVFTLDSGGAKVAWAKQVMDGAQQYQSLNGVAVASDKSVVVTGSGQGNVDFGDGQPVTMPGNSSNVAIARYAPNGMTLVWKHLIGDDNDTQNGNGVAVGANDDVFVTGTFQKHLAFGATMITTPASVGPPTSAMFVARLDKTGTAIWGQAFTPTTGGGDDAAGFGIAADAYGVVVGGYFNNDLAAGTSTLTSAGGKDAVAMKLAVSDGTVLWATQLGGMGDDIINQVALDPRKTDPLGASAVVGYFSKSIDVGGGAVMGLGSFDIFFARLAP